MSAVDWSLQRDLIRLLVKRVEIDRGDINVVLRVTPSFDPGYGGSRDDRSLHHRGRSERTALRDSLPICLEEPVVEHARRQVAPDEPEQPPIRDACRHRGDQPIVVHPVEELGQIDIHDELIACDDIGLRLRHRLVGGAARPEAVAVLAERRVPQRLKLLQNRLPDHAINRGWNAKVARPAGRLRDGYPTHRLRLVAPLEQLSFDFRPARLENSGQLFDGDPVNARRSLVAHHRSQSCFYVVWGTDRLHEMVGGRRAFGFGRRRDRFDLLPARTRGFTPAGERQVQLELGWRSRYGHETSERVALHPLAGTVRAFGRRAGLLCPFLTSPPPSGGIPVPSVPGDKGQNSWGKPRSLPRTPAGFTVLALDGYGLCDFLPARPTSPASYPVSVRRVAISLHASFRRSLAVPPLRFARASPPSGCTGDFHPQAAGHAQHTGQSARGRTRGRRVTEDPRLLDLAAVLQAARTNKTFANFRHPN